MATEHPCSLLRVRMITATKVYRLTPPRLTGTPSLMSQTPANHMIWHYRWNIKERWQYAHWEHSSSQKLERLYVLCNITSCQTPGMKQCAKLLPWLKQYHVKLAPVRQFGLQQNVAWAVFLEYSDIHRRHDHQTNNGWQYLVFHLTAVLSTSLSSHTINLYHATCDVSYQTW